MEDIKEKTADEMFGELGYEKVIEELDFFNKKIPYLKYVDNICYQTINFQLEDKYISMSCITKNYEKLLQAINKKCKELKWID